MTCEGKDYHNMSYEEMRIHAKFHDQKAGEAASVGDGKRWRIEQLRDEIMSNAATDTLMKGCITVSDGIVSGISLKLYIAGLQMQLTALEAKGGQNG